MCSIPLRRNVQLLLLRKWESIIPLKNNSPFLHRILSWGERLYLLLLLLIPLYLSKSIPFLLPIPLLLLPRLRKLLCWRWGSSSLCPPLLHLLLLSVLRLLNMIRLLRLGLPSSGLLPRRNLLLLRFSHLLVPLLLYRSHYRLLSQNCNLSYL